MLAAIIYVNLHGMMKQFLDIPALWRTNKIDMVSPCTCKEMLMRHYVFGICGFGTMLKYVQKYNNSYDQENDLKVWMNGLYGVSFMG